MQPVYWSQGEYTISTDPTKLDLNVIHHYLSDESYWAKGISYPDVVKSLANSLSFGLYWKDEQVGFARVVTDYATFAWIADVFILPAHRGLGLSKWLVRCIVEHPELEHMRRWMLATRDAHGLYARYGFVEVDPGRYMTIRKPN